MADHLNYSGLVPTSDDLFLYNVKYDTMRPQKIEICPFSI